MPGRVSGYNFKVILAGLSSATSAQLFPLQSARVSEMDDNAWYPWDDFTDLTQTIAAKLPPEVLVEMGKKVIFASKSEYTKDGYTSAETLLKDWAGVFNRYVHGAPVRDLVRTESYVPGRVVVIGGVAQPAKLVEGYLRGTVEAYGGTVTSFEITQTLIGGATYNRFVMTWTQ